jgi:hypothetical protein
VGEDCEGRWTVDVPKARWKGAGTSLTMIWGGPSIKRAAQFRERVRASAQQIRAGKEQRRVTRPQDTGRRKEEEASCDV